MESMEGAAPPPPRTAGGDSFEEFLDAQLTDLRERLVVEFHRRQLLTGPSAPLRACAQAWAPPAGSAPADLQLPALPNQVEDEGAPPSVVEIDGGQEDPLPEASGCVSKPTAATASLAPLGKRDPMRTHATWQIEDDDVKGKIKQFQDQTAGGWKDTAARSSIIDTTETSLGGLRVTLWPPRVMHPNGQFRITWDLIGAACILYDAIFIPLQFFLSGSDSKGFQITTIVMILFWCIDIPLNFAVGFHRGGTLEMNPRAIAKRYVKGWFPFDVTLITFDIILLLLSNGESPTGILRTLRTFRVIKSLRVARMIRLPPFVNRLQENVRSDHVNAFLGILQMLVFILLTNHMIACAWYGITGGEPDGMGTWIEKNGLLNASAAYLYATSMHWSLTQFTPASMEVTPSNVAERVFNIIAIVMGMVLFSSFVSRITNTMNYLRALEFENTKQFVKLQSYFRRHGVSTSLCVRVRGHLDAYLDEERKDIKLTDISLLQHLSEPLRVELHYETFLPKVCHHPFLMEYDIFFRHSMQRISHQAVGQVSLYGSDLLFSLGDVCSRMYFLHSGILVYDTARARSTKSRSTKSRSQSEGKPCEVAAGEWLAEAALWADAWAHLGMATANGRCNCITINVVQFRAAIRENRVALAASAIYAGIFVDWMNTVSFGELTDLQMPSFDAARAVKIAFVEPDEGETMA